jgi:Spy/CpxP family protein refolding chaperone
MKTRTFALALAIAGCLMSGLFAANVDAQPSEADVKEKRQEITEALGLNETQAAEMQAIHEATRAAHQALREQSRESGDRESIKAEMEGLRADTDAQVQNVLTPEQYNQLQELRPKRGERGGRGQGDGSGRGPGDGGRGGKSRGSR